MTREEVLKDMRETIGIVPSWLESIPDEYLAEEWELMKRLRLQETHIPNKYKELIGVAVAAANNCRYCEFNHTEVAKLFGASEEEIQEAVYYAKMSSGFTTYLHGMQIDFEQFKDGTRKMVDYVKTKHRRQMAA